MKLVSAAQVAYRSLAMHVYDGMYLHCKLLLRNAVQTEDRFGSARAVAEI